MPETFLKHKTGTLSFLHQQVALGAQNVFYWQLTHMAEEVKQTMAAQSETKSSSAPGAESAAEFRDLIRIIDKDVAGNVSTFMALTKVRGVDFMMANAICNVLSLDKTQKCGDLSPEQIEKIEDTMKHPEKYNIPVWLFNHRKDLETGADKHVVASDLKLQNEMDIRFVKKIRAYRGIRHLKGAKKVRGQRTRSTGRRGGTLGVQRKKKGAAEGAAKKLTAAKEEKKK